MKYSVLFLLLSVFALISSGQEFKRVELKRDLLIKKKIYNFGDVPTDTLLFARYYLFNQSEKMIKIEYVKPDCICTKYSVSSYEILPHDSVYIDLYFDTSDKIGEQMIYTVIKADTKVKMYGVKLKANVLEKELNY